ncbi:SDR family NAD(P)-dependent oxidoreductase [Croceicoccus marinus]|uniref:3-oxoacyl-ACP reductase n=1 Tax=Croceicoccus marinus TaxID=450378 RepID=A0A1Z1FFT0_9SPHN|nr:SDR family NAD(P)-dependent oxidoreductase [Croceicoccus marinus]ARU17593.1 3-oxoacyl-ACP reductase [Croceicoccus marinus]
MTLNEIPQPGSFSFEGRTAMVTGGAKGVGEAICREIHAGGGNVAICDIDLAAASAVAGSLDPSGESVMVVSLDVRSKDDFIAGRDAVIAKWSKVDILVNNAGFAKRTPVDDITPEEFDEIVAINMRSVFLGCQVFKDHMTENGYGRIVNITSLAGQNGGTVASPHYASSKAGAIMLTKYFAQLLADKGITVNAISPGPIATAKARLSDEQIAMVEGKVPIGRFMEVSEIAAATALLASDRGGFFVGATLDMNGGLYVR